MDSILDCTLYFVYDSKRDYFIDVYTDENTCQREVERLNDYSRHDPIFLRYHVASSKLGDLLLDLKNANL